jgi:hypothetical protein
MTWLDIDVSEDNDVSILPGDRGSMVLRNVGVLPHHYTVPKARRPRLESRSCFGKLKSSNLLT